MQVQNNFVILERKWFNLKLSSRFFSAPIHQKSKLKTLLWNTGKKAFFFFVLIVIFTPLQQPARKDQQMFLNIDNWLRNYELCVTNKTKERTRAGLDINSLYDR